MQTDATFCGQCGFNLQAENSSAVPSLDETAVGLSPNLDLEEIPLPDEMPISSEIENDRPEIMPETTVSSPIQSPWDVAEEEEVATTAQIDGLPSGFPEVEMTENVSYVPDLTTPAEELPTSETYEPLEASETEFSETIQSSTANSESAFTPKSVDLDFPSEPTDFASPEAETAEPTEPEVEIYEAAPEIATPSVSMAGATQLQIQTATLLHLQSNTSIEIPNNLDIVHFGKPNGQIPPDIDVSGFPDSEVVSRVHADIRIEGDNYFVEDTGSSNGTYINHAPLQKGNRHRLRSGDRIALGKGDLVTFIFQLG